MDKYNFRFATFVFALICQLAVVAVAQTTAPARIPVYINSGNPAFPFPQFLPYVHPNGDTLHNLGSRNPDGVTHAEMEKTIRDAYRIMMNRAQYRSVGGVDNVDGTKYIWFESVPVCAEGDGYALLAAAMMADKTTFDGLWLHAHDSRMPKTQRHGSNAINSPDYIYAILPSGMALSTGAGNDSAADADFDIALALMIAHMQWGDDMGIKDVRGNPISYKKEFLKMVEGMTDTLTNIGTFPERELLTGSIGFDGYFRGGNTWGELTQWAASMENLNSIGINTRVYQPSGATNHIDYTAPAYFRQFADYLKKENNPQRYAWNISQYERAEASSDWLMQSHHHQAPQNIPFAGWVTLRDTVAEFTIFNEGEDFRAPWRTVLNYVWHGNPTYTWDPINHKVVPNKPNTFQRDIGRRFAEFLWDRRAPSPWNYDCDQLIGAGSWWGPALLKQTYHPDGSNPSTFVMNWVHGTGSPSAVTAQDFDLMAEMYRQAELDWDVEGGRYLDSKPKYFHGFFRLLALMTLTGNNQAPLNMKAEANMKVYLDVDKTYAFENDTITYTIDYRNYGSVDAQNVVITNRLHNDMVYVSASGPGNGTYDPASHSVRWNIGSVPGFKSSTGIAPTTGTVSFKVIIPSANLKRYENSVQISCSNGMGWVSNDYPNKISSVMKRNGVDIARRALRVNKTVFRDTINPGMNATYTIDFENSAEAGWLNGGRPGVNFSYGHLSMSPTASEAQHTIMIRGFHDAHEAYIDWGNYRLSYFLNDSRFSGVTSPTNPNGWTAHPDIVDPGELTEGVRNGLHNDEIPAGQDARGKWNQRLILQLADVTSPSRTDTNWATMAAPMTTLLTFRGMEERIHRGTLAQLKLVWRIYGGSYFSRVWGEDWSFNSNTVVNTGNDDLSNWGFPISPDFTASYDPDYLGVPVKTRHRKLCEPDAKITVDNILIEEWDGYTWRRVLGNGPTPGREVTNVEIIDTIPEGVTYQKFLEPLPFGITPTISADGRVIIWRIPRLLIGEKGSIKYTVTADPLPTGITSRRIVSRAWASADRESPTSSRAILVVTTDSLPPPPPELTTMYKTDNKAQYTQGDTIIYTIAYKQTHGFPSKSSSPSEWKGTGTQRVNSTGDVITLNGPTNMYHSHTYGTNGMLTGTARPQPYQANIILFGRSNPSSNSQRVELEFDSQWDGLYVTIRANGMSDFKIPSPFSTGADDSFNYKIIFQNDSLLLWINDTSSSKLPYVYRGIPVQAGYAGVKLTADEGQSSAWLRNWTSHFETAYNVTIRDTIPFGIRYVDGSAAGQINTLTPPKILVPSIANNVITWPVVNGLDPADGLAYNDSLTVTWRAVVDTAKNNVIINTAYADLAGYPKDSIGSQLRSRFFVLNDTIIDTSKNDTSDTIIVIPREGLYITASPANCIFNHSILVTLKAYLDSSDAPDNVIYYTTNNNDPDPTSAATRRYTGQPMEFTSTTTLKAMAYMGDDYDESQIITRVYERLKTVPVTAALFFDKNEDKRAHSVKLVLAPNRELEPNLAVIWSHLNLIGITGNPSYKSMELSGDTLTIEFNSPMDVPVGARLTITEPELPSSVYTSAHGYLAANALNIINGFPPRPPDPPPTVYVVNVGPSPFRKGGGLNIFVISTPFQQSLDAKVLIYDRLGNLVAKSGDANGDLRMERDDARKYHKFMWNGTNRRGRFVADGTYLVYIAVTTPTGKKEFFRRTVYFSGR